MNQPSRPRTNLLIMVFTVSGFLLPLDSGLLAQGVTTAAIRGHVQAVDGSDVDGTRVEVVNTATGFTVEGEVRHERFLIQGLEVGGPYTITLERMGFVPHQREGVFLQLSEAFDLSIVMQPTSLALDTLRVLAPEPFPQVNAHGGTATTISDSLIQRLPTLNRDLYDFVRLVPQISTKTSFAGGFSGGGVGLRFNNFLINGVSERTLSGGVSNQQGGKSVPLEAVKEYQVLLAPYDVRYGDFVGGVVNTVTKSGTNQFEGGAFGYWRNDHLARGGDLGPADPYERWQYGLSLGGPIVADRLHFFVAPELQHFTSPSPGPYLGQPPSANPPVPVSESDLARLGEIMRGYGLEAGSGGPVENSNPLRNVFGRLDLAIPESDSRAVLWTNYARNRSLAFSRSEEIFPLTSNSSTSAGESWMTSVQVHTALGRSGAGHNELLVSHFRASLRSLPDVLQPIVEVTLPSTTGDAVTVITGTTGVAQGSGFDARALKLKDTVTLPLGPSHVATLGIEAERFRIGVGFGSFGTWTFSSLDSLAAGIAERFVIQRDFGSATVPIRGWQYAAYAGDQWQVGERVSITIGIRGDLLAVSGHATYSPEVDSIFGRRTDEMPRRRVHLSPRLGFTWEVFGHGRDQVRGGIGIFTGRPPLAWIHFPLRSYGVGIGTLQCGSGPNDRGLPPPFVPDYREAPTACASGEGVAANPRGDVDLLDRDLRMARTLRASLAYDRQLPWGLLATAEALVTRNISDFVFVNLNLVGPQAVDRYGRVLYGGFQPGGTGRAEPALRSNFAEVIDLRNTSRNRAYDISARLERRFSGGVGAMASYTYSQVRDVQTPLRVNFPGAVNWASRAVSGRHEDLDPEISLNDIPHRFVLAGTYRAPWHRWATEVSFYYVGESGAPFTYRAWGISRRGDVNADGSNVNDPIYVPLDASDAGEILFSGRSDEPGADNSPTAQAERVAIQQTAFEEFIQRTECLGEQRGRILERNSCREPWSHITIASVRQAIPIAGRALEAELDIFNVLNLLNGDWGLYRVADPALLEHVAQTPGAPEESQPVFRFDTPGWITLPTESAFQLQLALRYRF